MTDESPYTVRLATTPEDLTAAQALRYQVFVRELGGDGPLVDHARGHHPQPNQPKNHHHNHHHHHNYRLCSGYSCKEVT